jgi:hypothetical protein
MFPIKGEAHDCCDKAVNPSDRNALCDIPKLALLHKPKCAGASDRGYAVQRTLRRSQTSVRLSWVS